MLGLTKRPCYFVNDSKRRRALYLALVRSQLEHCSVIWRPNSKSLLQRFENLQKRAIKWILFEENIRYNTLSTYIFFKNQNLYIKSIHYLYNSIWLNIDIWLYIDLKYLLITNVTELYNLYLFLNSYDLWIYVAIIYSN